MLFLMPYLLVVSAIPFLCPTPSPRRLRESTLMSLIFVVDKLDENQMQDRLVRSVTNLQNDAEASIRTNATIFLGKIAVKLKEPVR
jgi:SCY1-like protein 1